MHAQLDGVERLAAGRVSRCTCPMRLHCAPCRSRCASVPGRSRAQACAVQAHRQAKRAPTVRKRGKPSEAGNPGSGHPWQPGNVGAHKHVTHGLPCRRPLRSATYASCAAASTWLTPFHSMRSRYRASAVVSLVSTDLGVVRSTPLRFMLCTVMATTVCINTSNDNSVVGRVSVVR